MNIFNQRVEMVSFGAFGVRIDRQMTSAISYKKEAVIALGGIGVNFLIATVGLLFYYLFSSAFSMKLSAVNIIIALFNMIPLDTLDMGRVLRYTLLCSIEEHRCDIILTAISFVTVNLLALVSIAVTLFIGFNPSLVAVTLYLYVITLFKKWS
jgi:Zn-dependent protease